MQVVIDFEDAAFVGKRFRSRAEDWMSEGTGAEPGTSPNMSHLQWQGQVRNAGHTLGRFRNRQNLQPLRGQRPDSEKRAVSYHGQGKSGDGVLPCVSPPGWIPDQTTHAGRDRV